MERHPIQRPSGLEVIGGIGEGNGSGFRAIGSTDKRVKSGELRVKNLNLIIQNS